MNKFNMFTDEIEKKIYIQYSSWPVSTLAIAKWECFDTRKMEKKQHLLKLKMFPNAFTYIQNMRVYPYGYTIQIHL